MIVGIPKEIMKEERRVSATPETVAKLISAGHAVLVESGAGEGAFFSDDAYAQSGARLLPEAEEVYGQADVILKVKEPQFNTAKNKHEADMMKEGQYLITFLHPASPSNHDMVRKLAANGVISMTLDGIPRISRAQSMDALTSMSTCAGYKGMLMAICDLPKFAPQIFCAVGMIKPANVLVVGAGVAGLQAIATAKRLGAAVSALDIRPDAAEQAKSLGAAIIESGVPEELAVSPGGYAKRLPEEWLAKERQVLAGILPQMDVVFLSALIPGKQAPILVDEDMVKGMASGSVIVDVSIDQGGNCSLTPPGSRDIKYGVALEGTKNIPGLIPVSSTWMFAQNIFNLFGYLAKDGRISLDTSDEIVSSILVTTGGSIVHAGTLEAMGEA